MFSSLNERRELNAREMEVLKRLLQKSGSAFLTEHETLYQNMNCHFHRVSRYGRSSSKGYPVTAAMLRDKKKGTLDLRCRNKRILSRFLDSTAKEGNSEGEVWSWNSNWFIFILFHTVVLACPSGGKERISNTFNLQTLTFYHCD